MQDVSVSELRYTVVVVTWECAAHLRRLVDSMNRFLDDTVELVVVDNASRDDPSTAVAGWNGPRNCIVLDSNVGYGAAINNGVEAAGSDVVITLNPDTELIDGSLAGLAAEARSQRALVGPRILNPDRSPQPSASGPPVGVWPWVGAIVPGAFQPDWLRRRTEPWRLRHRVEVAWLMGACVAAQRDVLRAIGPFDPAIHLYGEDLDLGLRARLAGIPSLFAPASAQIIHYGQGSTSQRFADAWFGISASNYRAVVTRVYGPKAERRAWLAARLNLSLRVVAKRILRRDARHDRLCLAANRRARLAPLPPLTGRR
jgi:GT2 family glycosyltransferase